MTLDQLVLRFQQKDISAFEKLYEMYAENICGVIHTIVKNKDLAEEIAQDVFIKVWNNAESYNSSKGRFFTWILNIARNAAIDNIRSKSYKIEKQNLPVDFFVGVLEDDVSTSEIAPRVTEVRRLLKNLKDKCVQLIELLYFRGYSQKEASEELAIPLGTVKTRNRNCIGQLRKNMTA